MAQAKNRGLRQRSSTLPRLLLVAAEANIGLPGNIPIPMVNCYGIVETRIPIFPPS
jgi:hypothetical protein